MLTQDKGSTHVVPKNNYVNDYVHKNNDVIENISIT